MDEVSRWQVPFGLTLKVESSEPRDVLQLERTFLTFLRFSTSLLFTALVVFQHFRLDTSGQDDPNPTSNRFSAPVAFCLVGLGVFALAISAVNYFNTVDRYARHKIRIHSVHNRSTVVCMSCIMVGMIALCVLMIVDSYTAE